MIEIVSCNGNLVDKYIKDISTNLNAETAGEIVGAFAVGRISSSEYTRLVNHICFVRASKKLSYSVIIGKMRQKHEVASFKLDLIQKNRLGLIDSLVFEATMQRVLEQEKLLNTLDKLEKVGNDFVLAN